MVQAVVFGPGRMGRSLRRLALRRDGHEAAFVGRDPNLLAVLLSLARPTWSRKPRPASPTPLQGHVA